MDEGLQHGFRLGEAQVHPLSRDVHDARGVRAISPLTMDFLMALAESPGSVIETGTLIERLPVESREQIERCLDELQTALGDSPRDPQFVRRVPDGYQLIAPVSIDVPPAPTTAQIVRAPL